MNFNSCTERHAVAELSMQIHLMTIDIQSSSLERLIWLIENYCMLAKCNILFALHVVGGLRCVRSVIRVCIICRRYMGQLPKVRLTLGHVLSKVRVDYAGPMLIKLGNPMSGILMCTSLSDDSRNTCVYIFVC